MRYRHDGFTAEKRRRLLKALGKTGCIADAARVAGISTTTVDRWRKKDMRFERLCVTALDKAGSHMETLAWERGVTGVEEPVWHYGKLVGTRMKRSDAIFRMLMIAANRKKYGRTGAVKRKAIEKELRTQIEGELRGQIEAELKSKLRATPEETDKEIMRKLGNMRTRRLSEGWTETPCGRLVPPGWGPITDEAKAAAAEAAARRAARQEG